MLSIRILARIGPWTLTSVERLEKGESAVSCERCGTRIREIWCLSVDAPDADLATRGIARDWRVGNECGPKLIHESELRWDGRPDDLAASEALWQRGTKEMRSRLRLISRLARVVEAAAEKGIDLPVARELSEGWTALLAGPLDARRVRRLNLIVTGSGRRLGLWR